MSPLSRILLIRFSSLGDIVLTSPVTRALRRRYPEARMAITVKRRYEPLARLLPGVDEVIPFDAAEGLGRLIARIRARRFDLMIDLHANPRGRILTRFGGARRVIRYRKRRVARMGMVYGRGPAISARHTVDLYLDALPPLGISSPDRQPSLALPPYTREVIHERLRTHGVAEDQPVMGLAPGASSFTKQWPATHFARLADRYAPSHRILLLGGPHDRPTASAVAHAMTSPCIDWAGELDLALLPAAIARCRLLVSNDTGPMHVASAVGAPVIGLFGPTHTRLGFSPLGPQAVSLSLNLDCSPCSLHGDATCWKGTHACLDGLSPDQVAVTIEHILHEKIPSRRENM